MSKSSRVCVGAFAGAHGVHGRVKVKSFTENPADVAAYGPLADERGERTFTLRLVGETAKPDVLRAEVEGVKGRDAAEALKGLRLYVDRDALPGQAELAAEETFYHADLIGLAAVHEGSGEAAGTVRAVYDFGAGDVIEIARPDGKLVMVPFTREIVPEVDIAARRLVVNDTMGFFKLADETPKKPKAPGKKGPAREAKT